MTAGSGADRAAVTLYELRARVEDLFEQSRGLTFHNWAHTAFVSAKAESFARTRGADPRLVAAAALVHDLNYVVDINSSPEAATDLRRELLRESGFSSAESTRIEAIVSGAVTATRGRRVDLETACLSDADTLYKALPITPVVFAHKYLAENHITLRALAETIVRDQAGKLEDEYYFYDRAMTERYNAWAHANVGLWEAILDSLGDPDVAALVKAAGLDGGVGK